MSKHLYSILLLKFHVSQNHKNILNIKYADILHNISKRDQRISRFYWLSSSSVTLFGTINCSKTRLLFSYLIIAFSSCSSPTFLFLRNCSTFLPTVKKYIISLVIINTFANRAIKKIGDCGQKNYVTGIGMAVHKVICMAL